MCGINGFIDKNLGPEESLKRLKIMNTLIKHRGPDAEGIEITDGIYFGHRRLSIIDLSKNANQPMNSSSGRFLITYNGEIYNFPSIKKYLIKEFNTHFHTSSDTEILVNLIDAIGLNDALKMIEGMYAFALYDKKTKKLSLARDRFGEKPLYWFQDEGKIYFSSELQPLINSLKDILTINFKNLDHFFKKSYVPPTKSIFNEIFKVKAGSYITFNISDSHYSKPSQIIYWDHISNTFSGKNNIYSNNYDVCKSELGKLIEEKVKATMVSDVPLGAFLSGGYDSSCVVAMMQKNSMEKIKTFSIGFTNQDFNEAIYAKQISDYLGTDHYEHYVSKEDLIDTILKLPSIYTEPFADSSQIPTLMLSELTRSHVTVSLSGDGGDELFGGYGRYFLGEKLKKTLGLAPQSLRKFIKNKNLLTYSKPLIGAILKNSVTGFNQKFNKLENIIDYTNDANLYKKLAEFIDSPMNQEHSIDLSNEIWNSDLSFFEKAMTQDAVDYLPGDILTKVDMAGMSVSLESRIPLLNHQIAEFSTRIPFNFLHAHGTGKYILKDIVHDHIPVTIMDRPKKGFDIPLSDYLRNELRDYSDSKIKYGKNKFSEHLNFKKIDELWENHMNQTIESPNLLWNIITFFAWHETNLN